MYDISLLQTDDNDLTDFHQCLFEENIGWEFNKNGVENASFSVYNHRKWALRSKIVSHADDL